MALTILGRLTRAGFPTIVVILLFCNSFADPAGSSDVSAEDILKGMSFSGQWFLSFTVDEDDEAATNEFTLKRGYVTVKKKFNSRLSSRVTQDIAVDQEGDGEGDIEIRLKYLYLRCTASDWWIFSKPFAEFGLVHRPWLDFEQQINPYRVQGTMYLERYKILRSADYGVTLAALLGGQMDEEYQRRVNDAYPGRYGSISLGVYNGGGYEAIERNNNKLIEARATFRPLPDVIPGTQISWVGGFGKGNTAESPELTYNAIFLSMEHRLYLFTGTLYRGVGDINGGFVDSTARAHDQDGFSVFGELRYPRPRLSVFGRYDEFNADVFSRGWYQHRYVIGAAYHFLKHSKLLFDYDHLEQNDAPHHTESIFEVAIEIGY